MFWDDNEADAKYEGKSKLGAGIHRVRIGYVNLDDIKDPAKLAVKYENDEGEAWQNFTFNDNSKKYLSWQLGILGVNEYIKQTAIKTKKNPDLKEAGVLAVNFLDKCKDNFEIELTEREYNGKTSMNCIVTKKIKLDLPKSTDDTPDWLK